MILKTSLSKTQVAFLAALILLGSACGSSSPDSPDAPPPAAPPPSAPPSDPIGEPVLIVGRDAAGSIANQPADWTPAAGVWNGKGASFHAASRQIAFESLREDIRGGSIQPSPGIIRAAGVTRYFVSGPATGAADVSGTAVIYVADERGKSARCIGCVDVIDGQGGAEIYRVQPSSSTTGAAIVRHPAPSFTPIATRICPSGTQTASG